MTTYYVVASGDISTATPFSLSSGGAGGAGIPGLLDNVVVDTNSNGLTITCNVSNQQCNNFTASGNCTIAVSGGPQLTINGVADFTGYTGAMGSASTTDIIFKGNIILDPGMNAINLVLVIHGSGQLTMNGAGCRGVKLDAAGITVTLMDNFAPGAPLTISSNGGTLDAATHNVDVTIPILSVANTSAATMNMGSGTWACNGSGANAWSVGASANVNCGTSKLKFVASLSTDRTQLFGGHTYYDLEDAHSGSGALIINDTGNTFHNFTKDAGTSTKFLAGSTTTITGVITSNGTSGSPCTLASTSSGTAANLIQSSGEAVMTSTTISDIHASGGANFIAEKSTDGGGNSGIHFSTNYPQIIVY